MERVFRTRNFTRWMRKGGLTDAALCKAVKEWLPGWSMPTWAVAW